MQPVVETIQHPETELLSTARMWKIGGESDAGQKPAALVRFRDIDTVRQFNFQVNQFYSPEKVNGPDVASFLVLIGFPDDVKAQTFRDLFHNSFSGHPTAKALRGVVDQCVMWFVDLESVKSWENEDARESRSPFLFKVQNSAGDMVLYGVQIEDEVALGMLLQELRRAPNTPCVKFDPGLYTQTTGDTTTMALVDQGVDEDLRMIEEEAKKGPPPQTGIGASIDEEKQLYYHGPFVVGKKHGQGKEIEKTEYGNVFFEGVFFDGERASGTVTYPSTHPKYRQYKGSFLGGYRHGFGKVTLSNGTVQEGFFVRGLPEGPGTVRKLNEVFQGTFAGGKKVQGKTKYQDRTIESEWRNERRHGKGLETDGTGQEWEVEWDTGREINRQLKSSS